MDHNKAICGSGNPIFPSPKSSPAVNHDEDDDEQAQAGVTACNEKAMSYNDRGLAIRDYLVETNGDNMSENKHIVDMDNDMENLTLTAGSNIGIVNDLHDSEGIVNPNESQTLVDHDRNMPKSELALSAEYVEGQIAAEKLDNSKKNNELANNSPEVKASLSDLTASHNKMPFGLCSNKNQESVEFTEDDDSTQNDKSDSSTSDDEEEVKKFKEPRMIDLGDIEIPEMMSPKSRIDYINDMRKQLGNLITKGPSIVATNLLHGVSEPPIGSPKDKVVAADIDTWEVLTPSSSASSSVTGVRNEKTLHGSPSSIKTTSGPNTPLIHSRAESFSTNAIPPIDPAVITDMEKHCKRVADSLDLMLGNLIGSIHNMSAITVGHIQTYKDAADKVGFTVDESVKAMYALIAKCEQLNKTMQPVEDLALQIKGIKKLLDELEAKCK